MKIVSFNGQYRITIPKDLAEAKSWSKGTKIRYIEDNKGNLILKEGKTGLNIVSYNNQYRLTLPKDIIEAKNWDREVKLRFVETYSGDIILKQIGGSKK